MPQTERPTGTVTLLFTDIDGSTRLLKDLGGQAYADALGEHRRLLRDAFSRHGGVEVDTQGDAFFVAFARASDAVGAAEDGQRALSTGPIRVRMGVHTGEPVVTDEGYAGIDVHRAARICAAAHGGQVLVSQTTRELIEGDLRDLGLHRLKDLTEPQRLYQLGQADFPPLKTLHQTNLPVQPTPLIGRARELAEAEALLRDHRLVTLIGPGGTGKTRLALQIAADLVSEFDDGVWWVPLAALREPALLPSAIAQALGIRGDLPAEIHGKRMLLLLDNFEQLIGAAAEVADLLAAAPELRVVVTSRRPLMLASEQLYEVPPLPEADAVVLFTERARRRDPSFVSTADVDEICRRLDGLPLAIELAAARCRLLGPARLLARLEQRLPMLTEGPHDAPERQRTLRATIDWSYDLLASSEQDLLSCLSVFAGGWTLEAAEAICDASLDGLASLHENSLVRQRGDRFFLLDTIREYAADRLPALRAGEVAERHARYYATLAAEWGPQIQSARQRESARVGGPGLPSSSDDPPREVRQVTRRDPGWRRSPAAARAPDVFLDQPPLLRAQTLIGAASIARRMRRLDTAAAFATESLDLARSLGNDKLEGRALGSLAMTRALSRDREGSRRLFAEAGAAARRAGDDWGLALGLGSLGYLLLEEGEVARAEELTLEAVDLERKLGNRAGVAAGLCNIGLGAVRRGRLPEAANALLESLDVSLEIDYKELVVCSIIGCAAVASRRDRHPDAAALLAGADKLAADLGLSLQPVEQTLHDETAAAVAAELDTTLREERARQGGAMDLDELLAYARESVR